MAKRFYKSVSVRPEGGAFTIFLDTRELKTPGRVPLAIPTKPLAQKLAAEWDAQVDDIKPAEMPITRLINVAREQTPDRRADLLDEARRYAGTDTVCYRAPQPRVLREKQAAAWDHWRDWAAEQGVALTVTDSLIAVEQPPESLDAVVAYAEGLDDLHLTLFIHLIAVFGSVVLALAVMHGALLAADAFDLSRLDQTYQIELWGEDEEQAEITAALREETSILGRLIKDMA